MIRVLIGIAAVLLPIAATAQTKLSSMDLLVEWRNLIGKTVTVDRCVIAGTNADFIRCETPNGAGQFIIDAATLDRDDLKVAYSDCPTGTGRARPTCTVSVTGDLEAGRREPTLRNAKIAFKK